MTKRAPPALDPVDFAAWRTRVHAINALQRFVELVDDDCAIDWEVFEPLEEHGLARSRAVTKADLDEPFAAHRGIEKGGVLFELTPLGRAVAAELRGNAA